MNQSEDPEATTPAPTVWLTYPIVTFNEVESTLNLLIQERYKHSGKRAEVRIEKRGLFKLVRIYIFDSIVAKSFSEIVKVKGIDWKVWPAQDAK